MSSYATGAWGERIAARHLEKKGWTVVARNFRSGRVEIDLIARRNDVLAFVEVKVRRNGRFGHPLASVVEKKRLAIRQAAEGWISRFGEANLLYRFDAVSVMRDGAESVSLQHVENAWGI